MTGSRKELDVSKFHRSVLSANTSKESSRKRFRHRSNDVSLTSTCPSKLPCSKTTPEAMKRKTAKSRFSRSKSSDEFVSKSFNTRCSSDMKFKYSSDTKHRYLTDMKQQYSTDTKHKYSEYTKHKYSSDMKLQDSTDMKPRYSADMEPQYSSDMKHQYSTDMKLQDSTDMKPRYSSDMKHQYSTDMKPRYSADMEPQYSSDMKHQYSSDTNDQYSADMKRQYSAVTNPKFSGGDEYPFDGRKAKIEIFPVQKYSGRSDKTLSMELQMISRAIEKDKNSSPYRPLTLTKKTSHPPPGKLSRPGLILSSSPKRERSAISITRTEAARPCNLVSPQYDSFLLPAPFGASPSFAGDKLPHEAREMSHKDETFDNISRLRDTPMSEISSCLDKFEHTWSISNDHRNHNLIRPYPKDKSSIATSSPPIDCLSDPNWEDSIRDMYDLETAFSSTPIISLKTNLETSSISSDGSITNTFDSPGYKAGDPIDGDPLSSFAYSFDSDNNMGKVRHSQRFIIPKFSDLDRLSESEGSVNSSSSSVTRKRYSGSKRDNKVSRLLTGICRHGAFGGDLLNIQTGGYFYVEEILTTKIFHELNVTQNEVVSLVRSNDKQRFSLKKDDNGKLLICANQGHSIAVEGLELEVIKDPSDFPVVVHGTYEDAWHLILETGGLSRMSRNHIHFATGLPQDGNVISGMRSNCEIVIYIDLQLAITDGYTFVKSKNGVILCEGNREGYLPYKYFKSVIRLSENRELKYTIPRTPTPHPQQSNSKSGRKYDLSRYGNSWQGSLSSTDGGRTNYGNLSSHSTSGRSSHGSVSSQGRGRGRTNQNSANSLSSNGRTNQSLTGRGSMLKKGSDGDNWRIR